MTISKTAHLMTLDEAYNRVANLNHIHVFFTQEKVGTLIGVKNNCLYLLVDLQPQVIPLRGKTLRDFRCFIHDEDLLNKGDTILIDLGEYVEVEITGFKLGMQASGIVGIAHYGTAKEKYEISKQQIVLSNLPYCNCDLNGEHVHKAAQA